MTGQGSLGPGIQDRERTRKLARPRATQPQARSPKPAVLTSWRRRVSPAGLRQSTSGDGFHRESEDREACCLSSSTNTLLPTGAHCTTRHEIETIRICICMRKFAAQAWLSVNLQKTGLQPQTAETPRIFRLWVKLGTARPAATKTTRRAPPPRSARLAVANRLRPPPVRRLSMRWPDRLCEWPSVPRGRATPGAP